MSDFSNETNFNKKLHEVLEEKAPDLHKKIRIAMVGKVSTGKSSLLNAFFQRTRENLLAEVGATSGITTAVKFFTLEKDVIIADCPGLDDIKTENSQETINFLNNIDIGIFTVTGSADKSQKENYEKLLKSCKKTFVVLNKADEWDDLEEDAIEEVVQQWKKVLGVETIYKTVTKGYDPKSRLNKPMDIRGINALRNAVLKELEKSMKSLKLQRQMAEKQEYAIGIISAAVLTTAGEAFIPGSAIYITATQAAAIISLNYLYTGEKLSKTSALAILPTFIGQRIGTTVFLWTKSFLPTTGVLDVIAVAVASVTTLAMLATVKWILENNHSLGEKDLLSKKFKEFSDIFKEIDLKDIKDPSNLSKIIFSKF